MVGARNKCHERACRRTGATAMASPTKGGQPIPGGVRPGGGAMSILYKV